MAILGKSPRILDVGRLLAGLPVAASGVFRVLLDDRGFGTAWLITDALLVTPAFIAEDARRGTNTLTCDFSLSPANGASVPERVTAELVYLPEGADRNVWPALLRLPSPLPGRALRLSLAAPALGDHIWILHYPEGKPALKLSEGELVRIDDRELHYTADTMGGSGGGPVLDADWAVVGMHVRWVQDAGVPRYAPDRNGATSLAELLAGFRESAAWEEIAAHHRLVTASGPTGPAKVSVPGVRAAPAFEELLLAAAVRWEFDPALFTDVDREEVELMVTDAAAERWVLRTKDRQAILGGVVSQANPLAALRKARGRQRVPGSRQGVIDRILKGPPFNLDEVPEEELPYWLQAVRWFAGIVRDLPSPAEVNRTLERKRLRSRLDAIVGPKFRGRDAELKKLSDWYADASSGPMIVSGIGGVGKSALVGKFVTGLPPETLLLWLDFDRADLAPDDAISMLRLLYEQAGLQLDSLPAPSLSAKDWREDAKRLGESLASSLEGRPAPLLVLDSFEIAQHVRQHAEIWGLLELMTGEVPSLHVLVSGRAPVPGLTLQKRRSQQLRLTGMDREHAQAWLREAGVVDESILNRVTELTHGVPLALLLAVHWLEAGGEVKELPEALPEELVEGFLYRRILDRVVDSALKPLVHRALVLRRLTVEIIRDVLGSVLPGGMDAEEAFGRLARELGVVDQSSSGGALLPGPTDELLLRPELRSATLRLLEMEPESAVRAIDEAAADWYAKQDLEPVKNRAELVYHRLRLGDVAGAEAVWRDECAPLLLYALDDLVSGSQAARKWLKQRTKRGRASLETWEGDALARIRDTLARGHERGVAPILAERAERSECSPLVVFDAWSERRKGQRHKARALLEKAGSPPGAIGRDRTVLGALLAQEEGDRPAADRLLATVDDPELWRDRPDGVTEVLAVEAARVRVTVDLEAELELEDLLVRETVARESAAHVETLRTFLSHLDVVLPTLADELQVAVEFESLGPTLSIGVEPADLPEFAEQLAAHRRLSVTHPVVPPPLDTAASGVDNGQTGGPWEAGDLKLDEATAAALNGPDAERVRRALDLSILGWRRWLLATTTPVLGQLCSRTMQSISAGDALGLAIAGTLGAFASAVFRLRLTYKQWDAEMLLMPLELVLQMVAFQGPGSGESLAARLLQRFQTGREAQKLAAAVLSRQEQAPSTSTALPSEFLGMPSLALGDRSLEEDAVLAYAASPDPLVVLTARILGVSERSLSGGGGWLPRS